MGAKRKLRFLQDSPMGAKQVERVSGGVKNMAVEGRRGNRRVLADIENIRVEDKPMTRFRTKVLEAQGGMVKKPSQKNEVTKPKPEIAPRKKASTLTCALAARSKVASGLREKTDLQTVDIDAADVNNELAVVEYVEDLYKFYKLAEHECRVWDYMHSQPEINEKMRAVLIDWLIEVHQYFSLNPETLYLSVHIIDRYLAVKPILRKELQLLGISALLVASKYEEVWAPLVKDLECITACPYSSEHIRAMEKSILGEMQWSLTVPTPYVFLLRFIKASIPDSNMENMAYFLAELGLMNYSTILYLPSMVAASAVYAARWMLKKRPFWDETLKLHTGFSEKQLMDCARMLVRFHSEAADQKLIKAAFEKYLCAERGYVALIPSAKTLLDPPP